MRGFDRYGGVSHTGPVLVKAGASVWCTLPTECCLHAIHDDNHEWHVGSFQTAYAPFPFIIFNKCPVFLMDVLFIYCSRCEEALLQIFSPCF